MTTFAEDLSGYSLSRFREDATAGLTVAMLAAPQGMAYATIADINPIYGLYSAIVVTLVASIFNSCSRLILGPTNAICVMIADVGLIHVMDRFAIPPQDFMRVVFLLTFMVGAVQFAAGLFRLGYLTNYISPSVIVGFTVGAALLIISTQLPRVFGVDLEEGIGTSAEAASGEHSTTEWGTLGTAVRFVQHLREFHGPTLAVGACSAVFTVAYRRWRRWMIDKGENATGLLRWIAAGAFFTPGPLLAIVGATIISTLLSLDEQGLELISLPSGRLPPPSLPLFRPDLMQALFGSALAIGFVGMIEAIGTGKSISRMSRESFNANNQLLSEALSNLAGAFFSGFAGASSFTRSALNVDVGAATRLAGILSACFVAIFLLVLSPLMSFIPKAALSGVLIAVGITLIQSQPIMKTVRGSRSDAVILAATALWAVVFSLEGAILIGVVLSVIFFIPQAATLRPRWLIRDTKNQVREKGRMEPACSELAIMDLEGELFFGAIPSLESALKELTEDPRREKILRIHNTHHLDAAAADELLEFARSEKEKGVSLSISGIRKQHVDLLRRRGLVDLLGSEHFYEENNLARSSTVQAVGAAYLRIGPHACDLCGGNRTSDEAPDMYMI